METQAGAGEIRAPLKHPLCAPGSQRPAGSGRHRVPAVPPQQLPGRRGWSRPPDKAAKSKLFRPGQPGAKDKTGQDRFLMLSFHRMNRQPRKVLHEFYTRNPPNPASWAVPKPEPQPSREQPAGEVGQEPLPPGSPEPSTPLSEPEERRGQGQDRHHTGERRRPPSPHPSAPGTLPTCYRHHPFVCAPYTGHGDARYFDPTGPAPTAHPRVTSDRERVFFSETHLLCQVLYRPGEKIFLCLPGKETTTDVRRTIREIRRTAPRRRAKLKTRAWNGRAGKGTVDLRQKGKYKPTR